MGTRWWVPIIVAVCVVGAANAGSAQMTVVPTGPGLSVGGIGSAGASISGNRIGVTPGLGGSLGVRIDDRSYSTRSLDLHTSPPVSIRPTDDGRLRSRIGNDQERTVSGATISRPAAGGGPPPGSHGGEIPHAHVHTSGDNEEDCYYYTTDQHWHCYRVRK